MSVKPFEAAELEAYAATKAVFVRNTAPAPPRITPTEPRMTKPKLSSTLFLQVPSIANFSFFLHGVSSIQTRPLLTLGPSSGLEKSGHYSQVASFLTISRLTKSHTFRLQADLSEDRKV